MRLLSLVSTALVITVLGTTTAAQSVFVPDNNAAAGTCNVIPFGHKATNNATWSNQRYQTILTAAQLGFSKPGAGTICDLAFVPCLSGTRVFKTIEIKVDYVKGTTLSQTFSANVTASAKTLFKATDYEWHNTANQWNRIGLQQSFPYISTLGNLAIEITVTGAGLLTNSTAFPGYRTGRFERRYAFGWTGTPPALAQNATPSMAAVKIEVLFGANDLHTFGSGCAGSNSKVPTLAWGGDAKLGSSAKLSLSDGPASSVVYLNLALSANQTPVDMGLFGAPKCRLYLPVQVLLTGVTSASGTHSLTLPIPNNAGLICSRFYFQYHPFDSKANAFGLTASNYGRMLVGR